MFERLAKSGELRVRVRGYANHDWWNGPGGLGPTPISPDGRWLLAGATRGGEFSRSGSPWHWVATARALAAVTRQDQLGQRAGAWLPDPRHEHGRSGRLLPLLSSLAPTTRTTSVYSRRAFARIMKVERSNVAPPTRAWLLFGVRSFGDTDFRSDRTTHCAQSAQCDQLIHNQSGGGKRVRTWYVRQRGVPLTLNHHKPCYSGASTSRSADTSPTMTSTQYDIELLRSAFEHLPAGLMLFRAVRNADSSIVDFEWLFTNRMAAEITGCSDAQLRGKRLLEEMPANGEHEQFARLMRVVENGGSEAHEFHCSRQGTDRWFANRVTKLDDGVSILFADVSEQRQIARNREDRWKLAQDLFMQAPVPIAVMVPIAGLDGADYRFVLANPEYERMIGQHAIGGKAFREVFPTTPPDARILQVLDEVRATGVPFTAREFEAVIDESTDQRRYYQFTCSPISDVPGQGDAGPGDRRISAIQIVAIDISDQVRCRQRAETMAEVLERNERQFEATFENAAVGIAHVSLDGEWLRFNSRVAEMLNTSPAQLEQLILQDITHPEDLGHDRGLAASMIRGEIPSYQAEKRYVRTDGTALWTNLSVSLVRDDAGQPLFFVAIIKDISERKQAEAALRQADRQKDEFLAMLSHELRNPLAAIRSACALLERVDSPDPLMPRIQSILGRQTGHVAHLLDELLDLARVTSGKLTIVPDVIDLCEVARDVLSDLGPIDSETTLSVELSEQPLWINGDYVRLVQVVQNLLSNAIKYTPKDGRIELRVAADRQGASLRVTDTGVGVDHEFYQRLFEPFEQAPQDIARSAGGLGLGLALSKSIVELHDGTITARSGGRNLGSVFEVWLPLASARGPQARLPMISTATGARVIIIEDNEDAAELLAALLRARRFEVELASRGEQGLQLIRAWRPDAIICDIGLPDIDGYTVARLIRADPGLAGIKLVALSGYGQAKDRMRAAEAGFDQHLTKPAAIDAVVRAIAS